MLIVNSEEAARMYRERYGVALLSASPRALQDDAAFDEDLPRHRRGETDSRAHNLIGKRVLGFRSTIRAKNRCIASSALCRASSHSPDASSRWSGTVRSRASLEGLALASGVQNKTIFVGRKEGNELSHGSRN